MRLLCVVPARRSYHPYAKCIWWQREKHWPPKVGSRVERVEEVEMWWWRRKTAPGPAICPWPQTAIPWSLCRLVLLKWIPKWGLTALLMRPRNRESWLSLWIYLRPTNSGHDLKHQKYTLFFHVTWNLCEKFQKRRLKSVSRDYNNSEFWVGTKVPLKSVSFFFPFWRERGEQRVSESASLS